MSYYYYGGYPSGLAYFLGAYAITVALIGLATSILMVIGMWKMFSKAGEPGWTSIIPFLNSYKLFKIGWGSGWIFLLGLIPIVNLVIHIMLGIKLARAFGKGTGFAVGLILLPGIFYMILGFSDAIYYGPVEN